MSKINGKQTQVTRTIYVNEECANIDFRYGPYQTVEEAFEDIERKSVGLTVGILDETGSIQEYWFKSATASASDLVPKINGSGGEVEVSANFDADSGGNLIATVNGINIYDSPSEPGGGEVEVTQGPIKSQTVGTFLVGKVGDTNLYAGTTVPSLNSGVVIGSIYSGTTAQLKAPNITITSANSVTSVKYGPTNSNGSSTTVFEVDKANGLFKFDGETFAFMKSSSNCLYYLSSTVNDFISSPASLGNSTSISVEELSTTGIPVNLKKTVSVAIPCNYTLDKVQETVNNQTVTDSFEYKGILYYLGIPYQIYAYPSPGNLNNNNFKFTFK